MILLLTVLQSRREGERETKQIDYHVATRGGERRGEFVGCCLAISTFSLNQSACLLNFFVATKTSPPSLQFTPPCIGEHQVRLGFGQLATN